MNNEHGDMLLKLLPMNRLDWKHVAVTAKIDAQGKFCPVGSLPSKIRAARDDESINTIVIADGHDVADLNELKLEEHGKIRSSDIPDCRNSFYHFSEDVDTPSRQKFFLTRAKSFSDACNKLHALEKWRRREEAKSRRKALLFRTFLLLFIAISAISAGFAWDYYREKTSYFADYVNEFGIPQGIFPLTQEQIAKRSEHYRFTSSRGKLQSVVHANSAGQPTPIHDSEFQNTKILIRPMIQRLAYDAHTGQHFRTEYFDQNNNVELRLDYSEKSGKDSCSIIDIPKEYESRGYKGWKLFIPLLDRTNSPEDSDYILSTFKEYIKIRRLILQRNEKGQIFQINYYTGSDDPTIAKTDTPTSFGGIFGVKYDLDTYGRVKEIRYLNQHDEHVASKSGVAGRRYIYQEDKANLLRCEYVDIHGGFILNEHGWAIREAEFDNDGYVIVKKYLDTEGEPADLEGDNPYDSLEVTYHENDINKAATLTYFYHAKAPSDGYAKKTVILDERGNATEIVYSGIDDKPVALEGDNPYDSLKVIYHDYGEVTMTWFYRVKEHPDGYAKMTTKQDECGNVIEIVYSGIDDKPTPRKGDDPYDSLKMTYHENGVVATQTYFYRVKEHPDGFCKMIAKFDEQGNVIEAAFFGTDGEPVALKGDDPHDSWVKTYHENGVVATQTYFYRVKEHPDGYTKKTLKQNERGNLIEKAFFGIDDKPMPRKGDDPYDSTNITYHENGVVATQTYFYRVKEHPDGYTKKTLKQNERGNLIELALFGIDDKPAALKGDDPFDSMKITYYENGMVATQTCFYRVKAHPAGYAKMTTKQDECGNVIEQAYFGIDFKLCLCIYGYAKVKCVYDERGNLIEEAYFGIDDKPAARKGDDPHDSWAKTYHDNDMVATQTWFYRVKEHPDGYAKMTEEYNERGNGIGIAYFGIDDKPAARKGNDPYDSLKVTHHENGMVATQTYFYHVKEHPKGFAKVTMKYNKQGKVIELAFFGIDDKPAALKGDDPFDSVKVTYHENGMDATQTFFYHAKAHPDGYTKRTAIFDKRRNIIEESYFGVDDKPTALKGDDPYDSKKTTYLENGEVATQTWFYRVKEHPDGYASKEFKFDMDGNRTEEVYRDSEGKQLESGRN